MSLLHMINPFSAKYYFGLCSLFAKRFLVMQRVMIVKTF